MVTALITALLAALCSCASGKPLADDFWPFVVNVKLEFDRSITSKIVQNRLKEEASEIWRPYGITLEWASSGTETRLCLRASVERQKLVQTLPGPRTVLGVVNIRSDGEMSAHALFGGPYHDVTGLMRPQFKAEDLASVDRSPFQLGDGSIARLRARIGLLDRSDTTGDTLNLFQSRSTQ